MSRSKKPTFEAHVGFAADALGEGIVYARVRSATGARLLRLPFRVARYPSLTEREVGYAALTAVASTLHERGITRVGFLVGDEALVRDLAEHREVPAPLVLPYVRLRCALNRFDEFGVAAAGESAELQARARAEVALHLAA